MSVSLTPSSALGFPRPLTQIVRRTLTITNNNALPVAFKVKTTAPKLYCVRPNSGRVEPGEHIEVSVMLQPMKEEPPTSTKCKDKFLIQSLTINADKEHLPLADIWTSTGVDDSKIHQHKIRVVYLPAEGQIAEEDEDQLANQSSIINDSRYDTVRQHPGANDTSADIPDFSAATDKELHHDETEHPADYAESHEEHVQPHVNGDTKGIVVTPPSPIAAEPAVDLPVTELIPPVATDAKAYEAPPSIAELETQLYLAQSEIERLRFMLETSGEPDASVEEDADTAHMTLRRRNRLLSDATSTAAHTEFGTGTVIGDAQVQLPEGVPLNVVLGIALGVFVVTYLFF